VNRADRDAVSPAGSFASAATFAATATAISAPGAAAVARPVARRRVRPAAAPARAPQQLRDDELLALLLGGGRDGGPALGAARALLAARGLDAWPALPPAAFRAAIEPALGAAPDRHARRFAALCELVRRAAGPPAGLEVARPEDIVPLLADWRSERREHFVGFYLNARHRLLARLVISVGSLSASIVHPREVFAPAVERGAAGLVVAHNHPSGDPEPSPEDLSVTRRLADAGELLGIELLDHIVVAERGFVSLKSRGHLR
jgi:DNA repair protein RadC